MASEAIRGPFCLKMHQVVKTDLPLWASLRHRCFSQGIHRKPFSSFAILLPISLERECCFALLYFQMQIQLIPVACKVSQDGTHCNLKPFSCPGSYSFKQIVPCLARRVFSDLAVKPAETFVFSVSRKENEGEKIMFSWIIQRKDLTYKSLTCYRTRTSKSAYDTLSTTIVKLIYFKRAFICDTC